MVICPGCRSTTVREVPVGKRRRAECGGCGRFVGWVDASPPTPPPAHPAPLANLVEELGSPPAWLYASKRLDLEWVPNEPIWRVEVFTAGSTAKPTAFYRLTPRVLVWLEAAGSQLEAAALAGEIPREQLDQYLEAMAVVWAFAEKHIGVEAVREARKLPPEMPDHAGPK